MIFCSVHSANNNSWALDSTFSVVILWRNTCKPTHRYCAKLTDTKTHRYEYEQRVWWVLGTCGGLQSHKSTPATCWLQLLQNCISQTHSHSCRPKKERCIWGQRERASTCIYMCDYTTFFLPTKSRRRRRRCDCCCGASGFFSRHLPIAAFAIRLWSRSGCQKNS